MTYTVQITVTDFKNKKEIQGASVSDGGQNQTVTTNKDGVANFKVESVDDDPDLPDNIQISAKNYGPQSATLEPGEGSIAIQLSRTPRHRQPDKRRSPPSKSKLTSLRPSKVLAPLRFPGCLASTTSSSSGGRRTDRR